MKPKLSLLFQKSASFIKNNMSNISKSKNLKLVNKKNANKPHLNSNKKKTLRISLLLTI
jgi:hypothetical protein